MSRSNLPTSLTITAFLALLIAACGGGDFSATTVAATVATTAETTTTTTIPPTTTTTIELSTVEKLGYPISDEWVVETVARDIDSGTGGLAIADDGTMFQGDFGYTTHKGNAVYRITADGQVDTFSQSDEMSSLTMTTFGADGQLYQSSYGTGNVFRIAEDGTATVIASGLSGPTGIVGLEDGTLFVEAYDSGIIHKIHPDGTVEDWVVRAPGFNGINGLAMGPDGMLYVANHRDGRLFSVSPEGVVAELHNFPKATSHVAYLDGSLFVTSRGAYVVYRYDIATGDTEIIAGNAEPGESDGRGTEASFGRPNAITVGPDGALYFNHAEGRRSHPVHIKRITHRP